MASHKLTDKKSYAIQQKHLAELRSEAISDDKIPMFVIEFANGASVELKAPGGGKFLGSKTPVLYCFFEEDIEFTKDGAIIR